MQYIRYELREQVACITLNRPDQLNALCAPMHAELREALDRAQEEARALLLTGSGRGFCAGQDLSERRTPPGGQRPDLARSIETNYKPLILKLRGMRVPTVCAVNGIAAGAGVSLALACDAVLAARSARFILAFVRIGLMPDSGSTFFLPRLIGGGRAARLAMTGEPLAAETARDWGMIWDCVDDERLPQEAFDAAARMACGPRLAYLAIREALDRSSGSALLNQLDYERDAIGALGRSSDYGEGVEAFAEKRSPRFTGS